jgi:phage portal protein BeeE
VGLTFSWREGLKLSSDNEVETKAAGPLSPRLQALLEQGPISASPDGSVAFFEAFGASYGKLYRQQSALRSVVDFLSRNIAQCRIRLFHTDANDVSLPAPDHPVQRLLDHPQKGVPRSRFMRQLVADKAIYDVAAVWKVREDFDPTPDPATGRARNRGLVRNLLRIPVPFINVWQGSIGSPVEFRLMVGRDVIIIPAADVIWMPGYSPTSNTLGTPPIETLRQILAEEFAAGKDRENMWKKGPQQSAVFTQDKDGPLVTDEQLDRFSEAWHARYGGVAAPNAREVPVLPRGLTPADLTINAQTAEYLGTRRLAREECCWAYGVQPQLLGITPSNFGSMDVYHQMLYADTLAPWMVPTQEEFEEQLLREFESEDSGFYLDFNINAKLQGSFLDQAKIGQQAVGGPWMTRNEFREKFQGLPPVDGGDEIIVPLNVVIGGGPQANPQDATNQFNAEVLPDGVIRLFRQIEGAER